MHALDGNPFSDSWKAIGMQLRQQYPQIHTVLCISAHWQTRTDCWQLMADSHPPTIHDFSGFPATLYRQNYPARGNPELADSLERYLNSLPAFRHRVQSSTGEWGLDHGMWTVLQALYPVADIRVLPISLNGGLPDAGTAATDTMQQHHSLGTALAAWRAVSGLEREILILGSGNTIHNFQLMHVPPSHTMWQQAQRFDALVARAISTGNHSSLWTAEPALLRNAHPTLEHYLPLLVCAGAAQAATYADAPIHCTAGSYPKENIPAGMRSILWRGMQMQPADAADRMQLTVPS